MGALDGKVAVVTGAARGIGRAIAEMLADEGADLALCDLDVAWLDDTAAAVEAKGRKTCRVAVDVRSADDVKKAVSQIIDDCGKIDILINNAGITKDALLIRMSEQDWDDVIDVNLKGTFLFTKAVARPMMKQRSGTIVNIASIIGLIGNPSQCNYAASKAGVAAFSKSAAKELAGRNVRVNAVAPGVIETKMTQVLSDEVRQKYMALIPLQRFGTPEEVAKVVRFLATDESSYLTGQVISLSGGMVM